MSQQATALMAKKMTGETVVWKPSAEISCWQKTAKPHMPATAMKKYDQISVQPEKTPALGPRPLPV